MSVVNKDLECGLQIGDICCSLRFKDPDYSSLLRRYYNGFLSEDDPDLTIDVDIISHQEEIHLPNSIIMSKTVNGNGFNFHSGLIKGTLNLGERYCAIDVKEALFKRIRIFEHFLFQTYYTLLNENRSKTGRESFLMHACTVVKEGSGYLFTGPSESGKSTIAKLSSDYTVLGDEIAIIERDDGSYFIRSTPFRGDFRKNINGSSRLDVIFLIRHGKKNEIKKIGKREFVTRFVREIIYPGTLLSINRKKCIAKMMDFCSAIADHVPFYELSFLPDKSFLGCIEELKLGDYEQKEVI